MELEIPGQLRGPECRFVMDAAIQIRGLLQEWFAELSPSGVQKLVMVLRVNGSLGSFGEEGTRSVELTNGVLSCDLVIEDHGWTRLDQTEISQLLRPKIAAAILELFQFAQIPVEISKVNALLESNLR